MEMKYNSLKEALPSLLEERARLETRKVELAKEEEKICKAIDDENMYRSRIVLAMLNERLAIEVISKNVGFSDDKVRKIQREYLGDYNIIMKGQTVLKYFISMLHTLIMASSDISLISNMNFKMSFPNYKHLFDTAFNDMLDTNSLAWIYKFSKNNNESLSEENMHNLVTSAIKTNIPAYMYLMAIKINNIPDEDMKQLIAAIVASNDRKYIDYLVLDLSKKGVSKVVRDYMKSLGITVSPENIFDYDNNLANELEQALLEDNLETLYKHGMYSYEDRAYVLSNIQAGL